MNYEEVTLKVFSERSSEHESSLGGTTSVHTGVQKRDVEAATKAGSCQRQDQSHSNKWVLIR